MAWARIDDSIIDHPKILEAGEDARDLFVIAIVWCNKHLTDGRIPKAALGVLSQKRTAQKNAEALVRVGLWRDEGDHWQVHDYLDWNPSRADVERQRKASAERMRKSRERRAQKERATDTLVSPMLRRNIFATDTTVAAPTPLHSVNNPPSPRIGGGIVRSDSAEVEKTMLRVLSRMNELAGTTYIHSPDLRARILEGVPEEDLLAVVESQWQREFMRENPTHFRPRTLFGARNFPEYLGAARAQPKPKRRAPEEDGYRTVTLEDLQ